MANELTIESLTELERKLSEVEKTLADTKKEIQRKRFEMYPEELKKVLRSMGADPNGGIEHRLISVIVPSVEEE